MIDFSLSVPPPPPLFSRPSSLPLFLPLSFSSSLSLPPSFPLLSIPPSFCLPLPYSLSPVHSPSSPIVGRTISFAESEIKKPNGTSHKQIKKKDKTWNMYEQIKCIITLSCLHLAWIHILSGKHLTAALTWVVTTTHPLCRADSITPENITYYVNLHPLMRLIKTPPLTKQPS